LTKRGSLFTLRLTSIHRGWGDGKPRSTTFHKEVKIAVPAKTFLETVASCAPQRKTRKTVKTRVRPEEIQLIGRDLAIGDRDVIDVVVKEPVKAVNIKLHPEEFADLELVSSIAAGSNTSELIRRVIHVLMKDLTSLKKTKGGKELIKDLRSVSP
jgi:hypothetical protein